VFDSRIHAPTQGVTINRTGLHRARIGPEMSDYFTYTIRYDTIVEFNVDSKAEYTA